MSDYDFNLINSSLFSISNSFVGVEASSAFEEFVQNRGEHITMDQLLDGTAFSIVENYSTVQHSNVIDRLEKDGCLEYSLKKEKCESLAEYSGYLSNELLIKYYHIIIRSNERVIKHIFNYKKQNNKSWFGNKVADAILGI